MPLNKLNGHKICGKRGGVSFLNAVRPISSAPKNGKISCPDGFEPCDPKGNPEFTICRPVAVNGTDFCPITNVVFSQDFSKLNFTKKGDAMPMMKFKLSQEQPCLDPSLLPATSVPQ